jgi:putative FmdB family regulatory protein
MPIYEFHCPNCHRTSSILVRKIEASAAPQCPFCGSPDLVRTVSGFAYHKTMKTIQEAGGQGNLARGDHYAAPRNIGRWTEKKFQEMGMEMPAQIQKTIQAAREGELPDSLEDLKNGIPDAAYH